MKANGEYRGMLSFTLSIQNCFVYVLSEARDF